MLLRLTFTHVILVSSFTTVSLCIINHLQTTTVKHWRDVLPSRSRSSAGEYQPSTETVAVVRGRHRSGHMLLRLTCTPAWIIVCDRFVIHHSQTHAGAVFLPCVKVASSALYRRMSAVCRGQRYGAEAVIADVP